MTDLTLLNALRDLLANKPGAQERAAQVVADVECEMNAPFDGCWIVPELRDKILAEKP